MLLSLKHTVRQGHSYMLASLNRKLKSPSPNGYIARSRDGGKAHHDKDRPKNP